GEDAFKPVDRLSGGEQSRVRLAKLVLSAPQVLILDEPTNHLDIPSREALEEALSGFDGTILAVSHDRYFLDRMATRLLVIDSGGHRLFHGNYSEYRRILDAEAAQTGAATKTQPGPKPARARRRRAQASQPASPYDSLTLEALEELILAKEARLEEVHQQFGSEQVYRDPQKTRGLQSELQSLKEELTALNRAWEERANDT
ncbi:MAG: ATP-binding cassette domain-containing protein, partial [Phycisphaerae bacterium]